MRVRITESFVEAGSTAVQCGCVLDVPDAKAAEWIAQRRAVAVNDIFLPPQKFAEQPSRLPRNVENPTSRKKARA